MSVCRGPPLTRASRTAGPDAAQNVTVVDVLPPLFQLPQPVTFSTADLTNPACNVVGGTLLCTADLMLGGAAWLIEVPFAVPSSAAPQLVTNTANVTSGCSLFGALCCAIALNVLPPPATSGNNTGNAVGNITTQLAEEADAFVTWLTSSTEIVSGGPDATMLLQAGNLGPSNAANFVLQGAQRFCVWALPVSLADRFVIVQARSQLRCSSRPCHSRSLEPRATSPPRPSTVPLVRVASLGSAWPLTACLQRCFRRGRDSWVC